MIEHDDLVALHSRARAGYDTLDPISRHLQRLVLDLHVYDCNSEEKRIAKLFNEATFKIAEALDELAVYTWNTFVVDHTAKCAEDACYLAESDARKEYGKPLEVICVERLPTEYQTEILWRVTMRAPNEEEVED